MLSGLGALILVGLIVPQFAHAAFADQMLADIVSYSAKFIIYLYNFFISLAFMLAGALVEFMMTLNTTVANTGVNQLVGVGWTITRDLANLGFVLAMIIIAFATIVGSEEYGYKKLLPKLIAAAILVNFSLAIGGVFIDFSNVITNFFMSKINEGGMFGVVNKLAGAFNSQQFMLNSGNDPLPPNPADEAGVGTSLSTAVMASIAEIFFITGFNLIATIIMFIFAIMLLVRFVWLSILLILAPITWLFWVIPGQADKFSKWWSKFMEQVFFAPILMFFLYLALGSAEALGKVNTTNEFFKMGALQNIMVIGSQMTVLSGILIGGLIAAQKMGIVAAAAGIDRLQGLGAIAKNYAGKGAKTFGQKIAQSRVGGAIGRQALRFGTGIKTVGEYKPKNLFGKAAMLAMTPVRAPLQAMIRVAGQGLQTVDGASTKPDSLGSLAWAVLTGGEKGVETKISEAKKAKETTSLEEDEKNHEKKLKKLEELEKAGVDVSDMKKNIEKLEDEMRKKTKLPETEEGLMKQAEEFELKREMLLAKGLKTSFFEAQRDATYKELSKMRKTSAEASPARTEWEKQLVAMTAKKDEDIKNKAYIPAPGMKHDLDSKITAAKEQTAKWQKIEGQKPKTKAQWEERAKDLVEATIAARNAKNDGWFSENPLEKITDLWNDAKKEIAEAEKKEKENKKQPNTPKEKTTSPIITEGFTENTPIANIRAKAAAQSREEERARRAKEDAERNAQGPKIIT